MRYLKTVTVAGILAIGLLALTPAVADAQVFGQRYSANYYSPNPYYVPAPAYYPAPVYSYYQPAPVYPAYTYAAQGVYQWPGYAPVYSGYYSRGVGPFFRYGYYRWR